MELKCKVVVFFKFNTVKISSHVCAPLKFNEPVM